MKKISCSLSILCALAFGACSHNSGGSTDDNTLATTEQGVATDFGNNIAMPIYTDLDASATSLNTKIQVLTASPTAGNLAAAQTTWRDMRTVWETSEGFLFGPVEDNEYDPKMDTWPTDFSEMDNLLKDSVNHPLDIADIESLDYTLRGYHPIEYMLWGKDGNKTADQLTSREKQYIAALGADVQNLCSALQSDWQNGFLTKVTTAGKGSTRFTTYQDFFTQLNNGMIDICNEVGKSDEGEEGKIYEPFIKRDSSLVESPYSENSMTDFKNNITGAYNVYLGKYKDQKTGLSNIVQLYNKDLDNRIKAKFQAAISSFDNVTVSFEQAIFTQRTQLQTTMDAIAGVRELLQTDLQSFIVSNIKN